MIIQHSRHKLVQFFNIAALSVVTFVSPCRGNVVVKSGLDPHNQQQASHITFTFVQKILPKGLCFKASSKYKSGSVLKPQANTSQICVVWV